MKQRDKFISICSALLTVLNISATSGRPQDQQNNQALAQGKISFPTPSVENVYKEWKPVDFGHPLRDATLFYAPPSLERVHLDGRSSSESRSLADDFTDHRTTEELFPVVIAAEPRKDPSENDYSVYGSPSIDYSKFYSQPPVKITNHNVPLEDGRDDPQLALQRDYFNPATAALGSVDSFDFPTQTHPRRSDHLGGIRYMDPPNRQPQQKSYFYYSENSPYYKDRLNENQPFKTGRADDSGFGIIPNSGFVKPTAPPTTTTTATTTAPLALAESRSAESIRSSPNAVVYSYENEYGQKTKVGVVLDSEDLTPDASTLSLSTSVQSVPSRPVSGPRVDVSETPEPLRIIPLGSSRAKNIQAFNGQQARTSYFSQEKMYPLGAPYKLPERPKFFPVQSHPPIYKTRPNHLEGVFGPAYPQRPSPDIIEFPREHEYAQPRIQQQVERRPEVPQDAVAGGTLVYKVDREMEFRRPEVILSVGSSNELYRPDDPSDRIWKPDFTDVLEENHSSQTEKPFPYEFLWQSTTSAPRTPLTLNTRAENPHRSLVVFPDEKRSQLVRPFREVSSQLTGKDKDQLFGQPQSKLKFETSSKTTEVVPNYKVVIGASYDDLPAVKANVDVDFDDLTDTTHEDESSAKFSQTELYDLCIKEVPIYLRKELCENIQAQPKHDLEAKDSNQKSSSHTVDNENLGATLNVITEKSVVVQSSEANKAEENFSYLGIPLELPVEVKKKTSQVENQPPQVGSNFLAYLSTENSPTETLQAEASTRTTSFEEPAETTEPFEPEEPSQVVHKQSRVTPPKGEGGRQPAGGYLSRIMQFFSGPRQNQRVQKTNRPEKQ